ncbi:MAG TPA: bifunctional adenosylcobinamide kinase/adenosylcobinamide-phosphate guanylyltransferase [Bryobacteraceae bacterium]|nr:bifunctional adenosylcobinamide kinase/adenosylcobinamide-phosphate guanylyltransferase [Bryobacteraceae bacterium]
MALVVVGGGRRSGKSRYAHALASAHGPRLAFVATMRPGDDEENPDKIAAARQERGSGFVTFEEPLDIAGILEQRASQFDAIVVDDLTVWVSNLVMSGAGDPETEAARFLALAPNCGTEVVVVTSDVDFGFPVDSAASRQMRRVAGLVNRQAAETASRLYWMVFGIPKRIR